MKLRVMLGWMGLLAASAGFAQMPAPPKPAPASPSTPAPDTPNTAPTPAVPDKDAAKTDTTAKKDATKSTTTKKAPAPTKKKEEPPAVVEGLAITRAKGGFLGLQVLNGNFVLTFYDAKKKKVVPDVARASLRWPVKYQPGPERTVLNPGGGFSLTSGKSVKPPLTFKVFISLYVDGNDEAVESYTVDYHGE